MNDQTNDLRDDCFVYIIESPCDLDLLDGQTEGRSLKETLRIARIPHEYLLVTSSRAFKKALGPRLPEAMKKHTGWVPILHFSCHGNERGLELTDGSFVTWADLRKHLLPLHDSLARAEIPFLLCISACVGAEAKRIAEVEDGSPGYWGLVGHPKKPSWADAAVGFGAFYHLLFKGNHPAESVKAMRVASGDRHFDFLVGRTVQNEWKKGLSEKKGMARVFEEAGLIL